MFFFVTHPSFSFLKIFHINILLHPNIYLWKSFGLSSEKVIEVIFYLLALKHLLINVYFRRLSQTSSLTRLSGFLPDKVSKIASTANFPYASLASQVADAIWGVNITLSNTNNELSLFMGSSSNTSRAAPDILFAFNESIRATSSINLPLPTFIITDSLLNRNHLLTVPIPEVDDFEYQVQFGKESVR